MLDKQLPIKIECPVPDHLLAGTRGRVKGGVSTFKVHYFKHTELVDRKYADFWKRKNNLAMKDQSGEKVVHMPFCYDLSVWI